LHDFAVLDDVADLGGRGLQQRRGGLHHDLFGRSLDAQREIQGHRAADFEH
jgi:hypothetical protein